MTTATANSTSFYTPISEFIRDSILPKVDRADFCPGVLVKTTKICYIQFKHSLFEEESKPFARNTLHSGHLQPSGNWHINLSRDTCLLYTGAKLTRKPVASIYSNSERYDQIISLGFYEPEKELNAVYEFPLERWDQWEKHQGERMPWDYFLKTVTSS